MTRLKLPGLPLAVLGLSFGAACGNDDNDDTPTAVPTATSTATRPPESTATATATQPSGIGAYPDTVRTNIAVVDAAIVAALAGDVDALLAQLKYQQLPCQAEAVGPIPGSPKCKTGEAVGDLVEVFDCRRRSGGYFIAELVTHQGRASAGDGAC